MFPAIAMADGSVVVFGKTGALLDSVSYSVTYSGPVNHSIFDLEIGTGAYNIYQDEVLQGTVPVSSENVVVFDSDGGGEFQITQGEPSDDTTPPEASITSPQSGLITSFATINVSGTASDANGIASISVNGVPAESSDNFATWTATISLSEGSNNVNIEATDIPGNTNASAASITVNLEKPQTPTVLKD